LPAFLILIGSDQTNTGKMKTKLLTWILPLLSCFPIFGQEVKWNEKAPMNHPVLGQSACFSDGKIYVTGGSTDGSMARGDYGDPFLQIYDIGTNTWSLGTPMPTARWMHGSVKAGNSIYCIGGGWNNTISTNEAYDISTGTWTTKAPMPTPRSSLGVAAVDNKIYAIGGFGSNGMYGFNQMYDPETNTWSHKAPMPTARTGFGTIAVDGKIYIVGGCNSPSGSINKVEVYNPPTNTWEARANLPTARYGVVLAAVGRKIYALGGTPSNTIPSPGTVEVYDIDTDSWKQLDNLPDSTQWAAAGSWQGKIYIMGGEDMCLMTFPDKARIFDFLYEAEVASGMEEPTGNPAGKLCLFPNPAKNQFTISLNTADRSKIDLIITDISGKTIYSDFFNPALPGEFKTTINMMDTKPGVYFVKLKTLKGTYIQKVVKISN
jgi:N-acetylneuraminic acid mutarotase